MNDAVKILVITVPSWNSKVGANSWATLLDGYLPENLASIYIRDERPDSTVCSRYFNISENKIIKSILRRGTKTGTEVSAAPLSDYVDEDLQAHNARYFQMKKKRRYSMLLAREILWKLGKWRTPELDEFLDGFQPDIILHSMDGYIHLNRIIEYAVKRTGAKAIGYIWDDNFTYKQSSALGYKIYRFFQRRSLKKLAKLTSEFFAISPFTKKEADAFFGINCHLLTKPLLQEPVAQKYSGNHPIRMVYTGSLIIGRDRSLLRISEALKEVNRGQIRITLDVYTQTLLPDETLAQIQSESCRVHKPIPQAEALQKQNEADVLLFLEDIDGKDAKAARLSFSTKITDYLSTGKCIFAVGNRDTAPMQYFIENKAAIVCCLVDEIANNLKLLCGDTRLLDAFAENACISAKKNHDPTCIRKAFDNVIASAAPKIRKLEVEDVPT